MDIEQAQADGAQGETEAWMQAIRRSPWVRRARNGTLPPVDRTGDITARLAREHRCEPGTGCAGSN